MDYQFSLSTVHIVNNTLDRIAMESQKPLLGDSPHSRQDRYPANPEHTDHGYSGTASFMHSTEMVFHALSPPPRVFRIIVTFAAFYFAPFLLANWLEALAKLFRAYNRWQQGEDITQVF